MLAKDTWTKVTLFPGPIYPCNVPINVKPQGGGGGGGQTQGNLTF